MASFYGAFVASLVLSLLPGVLRGRSARAVAARAEAVASGEVTHLPVWVRGAWAAHPGFWRVGRLELATGVWRPFSAWGAPLRLAGAQVLVEEPADTKQHKLSPQTVPAIVLTCRDSAGQPFQAGAAAEEEAVLVRRSLVAEPTGPAVTPSLRRLRNRTPVFVVLWLVVTLGWAAFEGAALLGAHTADGEVVRNRGRGYYCEVKWSDAGTGAQGRGYADCGEMSPGAHLPVTVMGWPRTGIVDDRDQVVEFIGVFTALGLGLAVFMHGVLAWNRRDLRRLARDGNATESSPRAA